MTIPDDGSRLWLRYDPLPPPFAERCGRLFQQLVFPDATSPTARLARAELTTALPRLLGQAVQESPAVTTDNAVVVARNLTPDLAAVGDEGFVLRRTTYNNRPATLLTANSDTGLLYGAFHLCRLVQSAQPLDHIDLAERPRLARRLLNHWDNLDGSIERGYAGKSLWQWSELPGTISGRYAAYARACASIGINGTVLNNVNANPTILTGEYLEKVAALADVFRPYHLRVYLSANFAAPKAIGNLPTADPLDPMVQRWWRDKAGEIYAKIPDFGGFLVKANSEGQPGPQDYGRSHADGANCLADALADHGGVVFWRAFVYDEKIDPDRAKRAYIEFTRLDGQFRRNVTLQIKNGPIDFQPREPFHPLFGGLKQTGAAAELQITQEYLGHSNHLVYLGTMWTEFLDADTDTHGPGSTVAGILEAGTGAIRLDPANARHAAGEESPRPVMASAARNLQPGSGATSLVSVPRPPATAPARRPGDGNERSDPSAPAGGPSHALGMTGLGGLGTFEEESVAAAGKGSAAAAEKGSVSGKGSDTLSLRSSVPGPPFSASPAWPFTAIAGVANTGSDANWTGHDIAQANWYAFGRLAWDPTLPAEHIAEEWLRQSLTHDPEALETLRQILLSSRETFVSYSMPLGLHHLIDHQPHYAPEPWNDTAPRRDWTSTYYHQAGPDGIGFDRTRTTGDGAVDQYAKAVADVFNDPRTCPEKLLLWFHHLPWTHRMACGRTLWQELIEKYTTGAAQARSMQDRWATLAADINADVHARVAARLAIQARDAANWRDACLAYFARIGHQPLPKDRT